MMMEDGSIAIVARPRVRREEIETLDDVQRMLWVLEPADGTQRRVRGAPPRHIIVVGRKRLTRRFWAFVADNDALGGRAQTLGRGAYRIEAHGDHTHLDYELEGDCSLCAQIGLPARGSFLVSVMNPDPARWPSDPQEMLFEGAEPAVATPFPRQLQERFGEHRYWPLSPEFLQYPGAELLFVARPQGSKR
jgi:hypothetical protein